MAGRLPSRELAFESRANDPLAYDVPLPFHARLYPMGYDLEIETNSHHVIAAANALWRCYPRRFSMGNIRLRIAVSGCSGVPGSLPMIVGQEHLVSFVQDRANFSVCDLNQGFTFAWLTHDTVSDHAYLQYHYLEPPVYLMLDAAHLCPVHASCVALDGRAVLLCGDSGSGKTSLAYGCARRGWTYISDDATHIVRGRTDYTVLGRPYGIRFRESARLVFPELTSFTPARRPSGKMDFEIATADLNLHTALEARATHVVFLHRTTRSKAPGLRSVPRDCAQRELEQVICFGDEKCRTHQRRALTQFLTLPAIDLHYEDFSAAEQVLRRLVTDRL